MATIKISDLRGSELENQLITLTYDEQGNIQGGKFPKLSTLKKIWEGAKTAGKWANRGVNAAYVGSGLKQIHDAKGHWWSFL